MRSNIIITKQNKIASKAYWLTNRFSSLCKNSGYRFEAVAGSLPGYIMGTALFSLITPESIREHYEPSKGRLRINKAKIKGKQALL